MKNINIAVILLFLAVIPLLIFGILDEDKERKQDKRIECLEWGMVYVGEGFCVIK